MSNEKYSLTVEKIISARPDMVFDAWLDQGNISQWLMPGEGVTVPNPEINAEVGGAFSFTMQIGDNLLPHTGEYKKINRPSELQFTWNSPHGTQGEDTLVTIYFAATDDGKTKVTLKHEFMPSEESKNNHEGGWGRILDCLEAYSGLQ